MKRLLLLLTLLTLPACTYKKAMESGALLESSGDLVKAMEAYELALAEKPGDPEATAHRAKILETQADNAIAKAEQLMAKANYEGALASLKVASAIDDDRPKVYTLTETIRTELEEGFQGLFAAKRYDEAYAMAVRSRALFGNQPYLNKGFLSLRAHYQALAKAEYGARNYAAAMKALDTILRHEPDQQALVATQRHTLLTGWADKHAAIAHDALRHNNPGRAAVSWIRAYEIAGRPTDRQQADQTLAALSLEGNMSFRVDSPSRHPRDRAIVELLTARLSALPNTVLQARSPLLIVNVLPSPAQCTETVQKTPKTSNFTAGTVAIENPEYVALSAEAEAHDLAAEQAKARADAQWAVVTGLTERLQEHELELVKLLTDKPALEAAVEEAQQQYDLATASQAASLPEWETALSNRSQALAELTLRLAELEEQNAPLKLESEQAEAILKESQRQVRSETDAAAMVRSRQTAVPKTVDRKVEDTLHWDLEEWTRTCLSELSIRIRPTWPTELPLSVKERHEATTADSAHIGHPDAKLEADAKIYPKSDPELLAEVDTQNLDAVMPWFNAVLDEHFKVRTTAAAISMSTDPHRGTTEALRLMLGAPARLDDAALQLFNQQIRAAWDIETTFLPTTPSETAAEEKGIED